VIVNKQRFVNIYVIMVRSKL